MTTNTVILPATYSETYFAATYLVDSIVEDSVITVSDDFQTVTAENYKTQDSVSLDVEFLNRIISYSPDPRLSMLLLMEIASK